MGVKIVTGILTALATGYLLLLVGLYVFQRGLMYHPGDHLPDAGETQIPEARTAISRPEPGLDLVSWYVPANPGRPTILYFQGNAGTIADRDYKARIFADAGIGIWLTGYRGFGGNQGKPTEAGLYADAQAALAALQSRGIQPADIVLYGESLGTGVAVETAAALARSGTPAKGIILEAPFTSMGDAAQSHYPYVPAKWLVRDSYDSLAKIAGIAAPLLILHGDADKVVPERQGQRLFEAAKEPKRGYWVPAGGHSDLYDFGAAAEIVGFINKL